MKKTATRKKPKSEEADEEVASNESDDGDEEGLEVDYMSDTESSTR